MPVEHLPRKIAGLLIFSIVAALAFSVFVIKAGVRLPFTGGQYEFAVDVPNASTLVSNADVRAGGVLIGHVEAVEPTKAGAAHIKVALQEKYAPIPRDTRARVQLKTVLGESYLALNPGSGATGNLPDGGQLSSANVDDQVQLDDILSSFDEPTRARLQGDIRTLGDSLDGHGEDLNRTFAGLEPTFSNGRPLMQALAAQRGELAHVVANTSTLFATLVDRRTNLANLVRQLDTAAAAAAARDRAISATVHALPATLANTRQAAAALGRLGTVGRPVLRDLTSGTGALTPSLRDLAPSAAAARGLLDKLPALTAKANPLLTQLTAFAKAAPALTGELPKLTCQLTPALAYLAPYNKEAGAFFSNVAMVNDVVDQIGRNPIRVVAAVDPNAIRIGDNAAPDTVNKLVKATGLDVLAKPMQYNPYPKPGDLQKPKPWDGKVPQVPSTC